MNFKRSIIFLIIIIIAVSILLYLQNSGENKKSIFTENLDSMSLVSYKIGADAINEIYSLHGFSDNNFKIQNGYTAKYIDYEGNTATIWVSESDNHDHAYALLESMNKKIGNNGMFTRPVKTVIEDITVPTVYSVKNEGNTDLIIESISTSCGCTQASLEVNGIKSPYFGMHNNPTNWSQKLLPGEIGELEVIYDPNHHPEFRGYATRIIYIKSNDPIDFQKEVRIEFNQVE